MTMKRRPRKLFKCRINLQLRQKAALRSPIQCHPAPVQGRARLLVEKNPPLTPGRALEVVPVATLAVTPAVTTVGRRPGPILARVVPIPIRLPIPMIRARGPTPEDPEILEATTAVTLAPEVTVAPVRSGRKVLVRGRAVQGTSQKSRVHRERRRKT